MAEQKQKTKPVTRVSKKKIETVKKLLGFMKNNDTIIIASIKNLPSKQFQQIRKQLKGKVEIMVVKKRIMWKAIENSDKKNIDKLKEHIQEDSALLFSSLDAFELAGILAENKNPIAAKAGQTAKEDIEIEPGVTDIIPGPAISEFGNLGIKIAVEEGKIAIKEKKVIVKAGEKINESAASIMGKLDIKPFKIGLEPIVIYEGKTGKIYTDVKIDKEKAVENLQVASSKAFGLAQKLVYYCKETISYLLRKANSEENKLSSLIKEESKEESKPAGEKSEEQKEEAKEKIEEKKEEPAEEKVKDNLKEKPEEKKEEPQVQQENKPQEEK